MNARILLNFRMTTLCRLLAVGSLIAGTSLAGCGATPAAKDATSVGTDDASTDDGSLGDGADSTDDSTDDVQNDIATDDVLTDADTASEEIKDGGADGDAIGTDAVQVDSGPKDTGPVLPICAEAKGSCALCTLCPAFPICTLAAIGKPDLKTYPNDCAAICALNAVNWPNEVGSSVWPTECPACAGCTPDDLKLTDDIYCVTLNSGAKVTVDHMCEVSCVADAKMNGTTPVTTKGTCKEKCTDPVANGGAGCLATGQPICAKEDNTTYTNSCQMENCDVAGCFPGTTPTATCKDGAMTKECDGACYDPVADATCTSECAPVCGIKKTKLSNGTTAINGISYRTSCIAAVNGASVGDCTGISNTPSDICAAGALYKNQGCCADVEYGIIHPVCMSQTVAGKPDLFVTFQNQGEADCLAPKSDTSWTFQYANSCICSCNDNAQPVCGANGITYQNACQADCYNPPAGSLTYSSGACSP